MENGFEFEGQFEITKLELVRSNFNLLVHVWTCICINLEVLQAERVELAGLNGLEGTE